MLVEMIIAPPAWLLTMIFARRPWAYSGLTVTFFRASTLITAKGGLIIKSLKRLCYGVPVKVTDGVTFE